MEDLETIEQQIKIDTRLRLFNSISEEAVYSAHEHCIKFPNIKDGYDVPFMIRQYKELVGWGMEKDYELFKCMFVERLTFNRKVEECRQAYIFGCCDKPCKKV
jgi:hypothetical protein